VHEFNEFALFLLLGSYNVLAGGDFLVLFLDSGVEVGRFGLKQVPFQEVDSQEENYHSVGYVAEHDSEQEGEEDDGKDARVDLAVPGDAVGIHDFLKNLGEGIGLFSFFTLM